MQRNRIKLGIKSWWHVRKGFLSSLDYVYVLKTLCPPCRLEIDVQFRN